MHEVVYITKSTEGSIEPQAPDGHRRSRIEVSNIPSETAAVLNSDDYDSRVLTDEREKELTPPPSSTTVGCPL